METIKERAEEYNNKYFSKNDDTTQTLAKVAYIAGATEQKTIDNAKAKEAFNKACGWRSTYLWFNEVLEEFIKALEE